MTRFLPPVERSAVVTERSERGRTLGGTCGRRWPRASSDENEAFVGTRDHTLIVISQSNKNSIQGFLLQYIVTCRCYSYNEWSTGNPWEWPSDLLHLAIWSRTPQDQRTVCERVNDDRVHVESFLQTGVAGFGAGKLFDAPFLGICISLSSIALTKQVIILSVFSLL